MQITGSFSKMAVLLAACFTMLMTSCGTEEPENGNNDNNNPVNPDPSTPGTSTDVISIDSYRVKDYDKVSVTGHVTEDRVDGYSTYGILYGACYGTLSLNPAKWEYQVEVQVKPNFNDGGKFSVELEGLEPGTRYCCRAFAKSTSGNVVYSTAKTFETSDPSMYITVTAGDATEVDFNSAVIGVTTDISKLGDVDTKGMTIGLIYSNTVKTTTALVYDYRDFLATGNINTEIKLSDIKKAEKDLDIKIDGLKSGTTYYYRPYLMWGTQVYMGKEVKSFTTRKQDPGRLYITGEIMNGDVQCGWLRERIIKFLPAGVAGLS